MHLTVVAYYWAISVLISMSLILSFIHSIKWVTFGLLIYTIRNIMPLFDPEKRREVMGPILWTVLI
jgi:hypothetical protein